MSYQSFESRDFPVSRGFTLTELLIVVAIAGILLTFAVPSFTESIQNNRMATQINELHATLSFARSEAVKRNRTVTVCRSDNATNCNGDWQDGWIVFLDTNFDGTFNGTDEILRVHGGLNEDMTLDFDQTRVSYGSSGIATGGMNGTFTLCDQRGDLRSKGLIIGASGRPRLAQDSDENGIPEDGSDSDLACS